MIDFRRVLETLNENEVAYIVIGGAAIGLQGSSYRTQDIDIVYARDLENVQRLVRALRPLRPRLRTAGEPDGVPFAIDAKMILNGGNFTLQTDLGDIDIMATIDGLGGYENVLRYADDIDVLAGAPPTKVLSIEGLIIAKRAANRPKDRLVLPELESLRELRAIESDPALADGLRRGDSLPDVVPPLPEREYPR